MVPPPPGRLSTMNCWPNLSESLWAKVRAMMSVPPPGLNGTIKRTGLVGHVEVLAPTAADAERAATMAAMHARIRRVNAQDPVTMATLASLRSKEHEQYDQKGHRLKCHAPIHPLGAAPVANLAVVNH